MNDFSGNNFSDGQPARTEDLAAAAAPDVFDNAREPIGMVLEIAGAGSQMAFDLQRLTECSADPDPAIALAGKVGSQVKIRVGNG